MTQSTFGRRLLVCAGIAVLLSAWPQTASARQSPAWGPVRAGIISIQREGTKRSTAQVWRGWWRCHVGLAASRLGDAGLGGHQVLALRSR
jgi:hypothetical protein